MRKFYPKCNSKNKINHFLLKIFVFLMLNIPIYPQQVLTKMMNLVAFAAFKIYEPGLHHVLYFTCRHNFDIIYMP